MKPMPKPKKLNLLGSKVYYWEFNQDRPQTIVMVHGFRGTHHGLQKVIDALPDFHIIIPDLPGFGESAPMKGRTHDIQDYKEFVIAFIKALKLKRPDLLGHSFGSIVASAVATTNPPIIRKLVLVNPIARAANQDRRKWLLGGLHAYYWLGKTLPKRLGRALLANRLIVLSVSTVMATTKDRLLRREIHQGHLQHFSTFYDPKLLTSVYNASVKASVGQFADKVNVPVLLIAGESDMIAPLAHQPELQKILKAELVAIKDVGHLIHHETPEQAAEATRRFLQAA